jgi:alpha-beta hydrolase superfamily lysophospholipase
MSAVSRRLSIVLGVMALWWCALGGSQAAWAESRETIVIRGQAQSLHLYGRRGDPPVIVSSGDGGWMHLAPQVASVLAAHGYFVVGIDARAYLESFTSGTTALSPADVPRDYQQLVEFASRGAHVRPVLVGVSEGAGLSVLAAADPDARGGIAGVMGLGLPDLTELGWRWRDAMIYLTHGHPNEPAFSTSAVVERVSPVPLALVHATEDEFVPMAEIQRIFAAAREPKKLWIVKASNHRFSDNREEFERRLLEAMAWITETSNG